MQKVTAAGPSLYSTRGPQDRRWSSGRLELIETLTAGKFQSTSFLPLATICKGPSTHEYIIAGGGPSSGASETCMLAMAY